MITAFHGIGAYRGQKNPMALHRALNTALGGVELCVSERAIGAFGAVFIGECTATFKSDAWSEVGANGNRICGYNSEGVPNSQKEWECFAMESIKPDAYSGPRDYTEAWMRPATVRALWVKEWASESTKRAARIMARHRGVPLLILGGENKIWHVLDELNIPVVVDQPLSDFRFAKLAALKAS